MRAFHHWRTDAAWYHREFGQNLAGMPTYVQSASLRLCVCAHKYSTTVYCDPLQFGYLVRVAAPIYCQGQMNVHGKYYGKCTAHAHAVITRLSFPSPPWDPGDEANKGPRLTDKYANAAATGKLVHNVIPCRAWSHFRWMNSIDGLVYGNVLSRHVHCWVETS